MLPVGILWLLGDKGELLISKLLHNLRYQTVITMIMRNQMYRKYTHNINGFFNLSHLMKSMPMILSIGLLTPIFLSTVLTMEV